MQKNWYKKLAQKTEHPAGLNKWGRSGLGMFCGLITGLLPGLVGRLGLWWCVFCVRPGPMAVACFTYGWGRCCAWLSVGACPVGAWEQWRWRVLRAGSVGLLLRRRILVEVRTLLCGAYSGCGWAPPYLCVWSGHLAAGRFLCTAPGPVAVSVFCVCLGSLWGVFCVLLWAVPGTAGPIIVWVSGSVA